MAGHATQVPMDDEHLARYGANAARGLHLEGSVPVSHLRRSLRQALNGVERTRSALTQWGAGRQTLPVAAEWVLDNAYLALREGKEAQQSFHRGRPLRGCGGEGTVLQACARGAVWAVPDLDHRRLEVFLTGFQSVCPLTERELSLLIPALCHGLLHQLDTLCRDLEALKDGKVPGESVGSVFSGLRALGSGDWTALLEGVSVVEQLLRQDPSGDYPKMDEGSRCHYRQQLCRLARRNGLDEGTAARRALELAQGERGRRGHVGRYLFTQPMGEVPSHNNGRIYGLSVLSVTLTLALTAAALLQSVVLGLLLAFPISDLVKNCLDFLAVRLVRPRPIHRMELKDGIPAQGRTLCVVVSLLTGEDSGGELSQQIERYRLANRDSGAELRFGLLCDLPDSPTPMGAKGQRCVDAALRAVEALNTKHGGGFYLFFRKPTFQPRDERYQGWERKRGALLELTRLLKGRRTGLQVLAGDEAALRGTRYVITLDGDTALSVGAARELVGAMLHPLNRPLLDRERRVVTGGYALLQPRVSVALEAANKSLFSRIFAGQGGVDPYGSTASDVYHDLFDQGSYTGKGIFDVDLFYTCLDRRFPENTILSHDLLEGAYLHAGLLGEVELTDGFPWRVDSYFSRLHRWVRGDWQVLPWVLPTVPDGQGGREVNPLPALARWKLFDNLRRSLSPVFTLLALVLGICDNDAVFAVAGAVAVLAAASNLLLSGVELAARRGVGSHVRYHSTIVAGFAGVVLQTVVQLLFLPFQAYVCLTATCTALWRMAVTRRDLLAWVTAAQADRRKGGLLAYFRTQWCAVAVGLFTILGAELRFGALVGLLWALSPLLGWYLSRPTGKRGELSQSDRALLLHEATQIWGYFDRFLRSEDHYLPPDNWQEQPSVGPARRTSPTNIGMALLSVMAAADLELTDRGAAAERIGHMLTGVEGLEKWQGHLYNWYDTVTAAPMPPRYVSTVDSGNLCTSLIALEQGLLEWGEGELAQRAGRLAQKMDFRALYDGERRLFSIGWEEESGKLTQGWYDLMASEARQTSFVAVARGEVEPRHWRRLGRMLLGDNDYRGMASWTGTMFEYFMPNLLLPCEENSLMYESLAFCVYAQKRRGAAARVPWGISESGFYAFDGAMNYQYKAHGVQSLGLKRGLDQELVLAPYATFLALLLAPRSATRNLRRLREMGAEGPFGLYEAIDCTPSRCTGQAPFELVRSYMSHHLGMSLVAIDNTLKGNIMQRRFMANSDMAAYRELLQERLPVGGPVMRNVGRDGPEKPKRYDAPSLLRQGEGYSRLAPQCHLLSSGGYGVFACDNGLTRSHLGEDDLTLARPGSFYAPSGISAFFQGEDGLFGLTPAPLYQGEGEFCWEFYSDGALWSAKRGDLSARTLVTVPPGQNGELRRFEVYWGGDRPVEGELLIYCEPVLCTQRDYLAHPAFSKLFLESAPIPGGVVFTRRSRGKEGHPALAVVWEGEEVTFTCSRDRALGRGGLRALAGREGGPLDGACGGQPEPCLMLRLPVRLTPGGRAELRLALSASDSAATAVDGAHRILEGKRQGGGRLAGLSHKLGLEEYQALDAFHLLRRLAQVRPGLERALPQSALWPFGVSGDLPIALGRVGAGEEERGALWCRQHQLLTQSGWPFDLVLLIDEGGDYRQPLHTALRAALTDLGAEPMLGVRGGIHLVRAEEESCRALSDWAAARLPLEAVPDLPDVPAPAPVAQEGGVMDWGYDEMGNVVLHTGSRLPPVGWSQVLCNEDFGWFTDETGAGILWLANSREGRLTPWRNDPLAVGGDERITIRSGDRDLSLFADGDGQRCTVTYGLGWARWEKEVDGGRVVTTAWVPVSTPCRILTLEIFGAEGAVSYCMEGKQALSLLLRPGEGAALITQAAGGRTQTRHLMDLGDSFLRENALDWVKDWWAQRTAPIQVSTPDPMLDRYLNGWSLYQVLACRVYARTSQYQNGGAYGFRDQLQDVCALLYTAPQTARAQLIRAAARQFQEGDVQHWWHPPQGAGVRTRITDDLLFLPYVLCRYLEVTGDREILDEQIPFLSAPPLKTGEMERYDVPQVSDERATLFSHAQRAVECFLDRGWGSHGLALMGAGDWNDGMNRVGSGGKGESVWLSWFGALVLETFAPLCNQMGADVLAQRCSQAAQALTRAAQQAWDGGWYLRGYYDDGTPLGASGADQCAIDSIAQSFSVLVAGADRGRGEVAVTAALARLYDRQRQMVRLFDPPFAGRGKDPGYIRGYLPGVRENGGQYTHGAVWLALALFRLGRGEEGHEILSALLPANHPQVEYRAEPYVIAADVYAAPGHEGRAGWSWYTGAAGWYWRVAVEELLGLKVVQGKLTVAPCLPQDWPGYTATWALPGGTLEISVVRTGRSIQRLDGAVCSDGVELKHLSGSHRLEVEIEGRKRVEETF